MGAQARDGLTSRAIRRLLDAAGEDLPGMFLMALADTMAGQGSERPVDAEERLLALYQEVAGQRDRWLAAAMAAPPLLGGRDLMAGLGIPPGPTVGRLLAAIREAQLEGEVSTKSEALALARTISPDTISDGDLS
jgi:poly(A) polymerase